MLSVKQGSIKYHLLSLWYDLTWDWTPVSWTIGEHSGVNNTEQSIKKCSMSAGCNQMNYNWRSIEWAKNIVNVSTAQSFNRHEWDVKKNLFIWPLLNAITQYSNSIEFPCQLSNPMREYLADACAVCINQTPSVVCMSGTKLVWIYFFFSSTGCCT